MARVCILTPDPGDPSFAGRWSEVRDRMAVPLAAEGVQVESRPWTQVGGWTEFDLVLPLTAWGYHRRHEDWLTATQGWAKSDTPFLNPPSVLAWNSDKQYLQRLFQQGAPVVPTRFVDKVTQQDLAIVAEKAGTDELIVKPQVSASAYQTIRVRPGDPLNEAPDGPAMIQPFLQKVQTDGELSLIYIAGEFSHAIRKVPVPGDFRVQPEWGGHISAYDPEPDVREAADRILAAVEEPLLYARVDLVRGKEDRPLLMELELVEPDLYLGFDPTKGAGFAKAVRAAAKQWY